MIRFLPKAVIGALFVALLVQCSEIGGNGGDSTQEDLAESVATIATAFVYTLDRIALMQHNPALVTRGLWPCEFGGDSARIEVTSNRQALPDVVATIDRMECLDWLSHDTAVSITLAQTETHVGYVASTFLPASSTASLTGPNPELAGCFLEINAEEVVGALMQAQPIDHEQIERARLTGSATVSCNGQIVLECRWRDVDATDFGRVMSSCL